MLRDKPWSIYFGDTAAGYLIYLASGGRLFRHIEEKPGFEVPTTFKHISEIKEGVQSADVVVPIALKTTRPAENEAHSPSLSKDNEKMVLSDDASKGEILSGGLRGPLATVSVRQSEHPSWHHDKDFIIVDWYGDDDLENPYNWPLSVKCFFLGVLGCLTFVCYMGASAITPGLPFIVEKFGISEILADCCIGFYVLGYSLGPLLFAPASEIPAIGRLPMYVAPLWIYFAIGWLPAFSEHLGSLIAGRILTGFFASPALATGGASVSDVLSPLDLPYGLCAWVAAAFLGPGLGPVVTGYAVQHYQSYKPCLWILSLFTFAGIVVVMFCMPETSGPNILARRAARIRKLTGDQRYRSLGEIHQDGIKPTAVLREAIMKPFEISIKDPSILYVHVYISAIYAFYYLTFAGFPLIFFELYHFDLGNGQLPFLSICAGGVGAAFLYAAMYRYIALPEVLKGTTTPEDGLVPALPFSFLASASLFAVGWSAGRCHWIVPTVMTMLFAASNFFILQPLSAYVALAYPAYAASLFAVNDFLRSMTAFAVLCGGTPLFVNLGIGPGYSLLGALLAACIPPLFFLRYYGDKLRKRSSFAHSS